MVHQRSTLGQRIVEAARLALVTHLRQELDEARQRQHEATGGAGPHHSTEGELPATDGRLARLSLSVEGGAE
jgi:hypothetical protein